MANLVAGVRFPAFILPDEQGEPFNLRRKLADSLLMLVFTRSALHDLLAVVGSALSVRSGLADGDHVQSVAELAVF
jgi:hypothetical protein